MATPELPATGDIGQTDELVPFQLRADQATTQRDRDRAPNLVTVGDAYAWLQTRVQKQIDLALAEGDTPNESRAGDAAVRDYILLLLPEAEQRRLFLRTANSPRAWPRLKPLFGAPPYNFLKPEDAGLLRAGGFAVGRKNMVYNDPSRIANQAQFGPGQMVDEYTREYRVVQGDNTTEGTLLPGVDVLQRKGGDLHLQVRIAKTTKLAKREIERERAVERKLRFPMPGERLVLSDTRTLLKARGLSRAQQVQVVVRALRPRGPQSHTAAMLVRAL